MEKEDDLKLIDNHMIETQSHWVFLVVLFFTHFIADQMYILFDNYNSSILDNLDTFTGDYTYAVFVSVLMLSFMKISSLYMQELNIDSKPQTWVWVTAILILTHPFRFYMTEKNVNMNFEIFGIITRSFEGSNELFIFLISSLILLFASFGGVQMILMSERKDIGDSKKFIEMISIDFLPALGLIFSILYIAQSYVLSEAKEFDFSQPIIFLFYIIFANSSVPNIFPASEIEVSPLDS